MRSPCAPPAVVARVVVMVAAAAATMMMAATIPARADVAGDLEIARSRFALGELLYSSEHYAEAAQEFEAARRLKPRPDFDYNIARCYERLKQWDATLEAYRRYVESEPTPLDAEQMLARMDEIRALMKTEQARPSAHGSSSSSNERSTPVGRGGEIAGLALAGLGLGSLGAGIGFGVASNSTADGLTALDRNRQAFDPGRERDLDTQRLLEGTFVGVGVAALIAGTVVYTFARLKHRRSGRQAASPSAAMAGLRVAF